MTLLTGEAPLLLALCLYPTQQMTLSSRLPICEVQQGSSNSHWSFWNPSGANMKGKNVYVCIHTGISCFLKVHIILLGSYKRLTLVPVITNWNKSEEDFPLLRKKVKSKNRAQCSFAASYYRGSVHPKQREWPCQAPSLGTTPVSELETSITLHCVPEHLCFLWIYFVFPSARCVL